MLILIVCVTCVIFGLYFFDKASPKPCLDYPPQFLGRTTSGSAGEKYVGVWLIVDLSSGVTPTFSVKILKGKYEISTKWICHLNSLHYSYSLSSERWASKVSHGFVISTLTL